MTPVTTGRSHRSTGSACCTNAAHAPHDEHDDEDTGTGTAALTPTAGGPPAEQHCHGAARKNMNITQPRMAHATQNTTGAAHTNLHEPARATEHTLSSLPWLA